MRNLSLLLVTALVLAGTCAAYAQEDDGWGEITGLMNQMGGINQQLAGAGVQWVPGQTTSGSMYVDNLAYWFRVYAQLLNSVDPAFADGAGTGAGAGQAAARDPFDPRVADMLQRQLWQMQMMQPDLMRAYQNNMLYQMNQQP